MPSPLAIKNKANALLKRYAGADARLIYKRITILNGDTLTGRTTTTVTDTLLDPQPFAYPSGRDKLYGGHAQPDTIMDASGTPVLIDDWEMVISADALTADEWKNPTLQFVFKSADGSEEVMQQRDFTTAGFEGVTVLMTIYLRSVTRP